MENPNLKWDFFWGYPYFRKPPIYPHYRWCYATFSLLLHQVKAKAAALRW